MRSIIVDIAKPLWAKSLGISCDPQDIVFVAGSPSSPAAFLLARPTMFVHQFDFLTPNLPPTYKVALSRSLMAFAQGWAVDRQQVTSGCLFRVQAGNGTMETFARTLGGEVDTTGTIYRIDRASGSTKV